MKYIIDEEELRKAVLRGFEDNNWNIDGIDVDSIVFSILESKTPLEVAGGGKLDKQAAATEYKEELRQAIVKGLRSRGQFWEYNKDFMHISGYELSKELDDIISNIVCDKDIEVTTKARLSKILTPNDNYIYTNHWGTFKIRKNGAIMLEIDGEIIRVQRKGSYFDFHKQVKVL